MVPDHLYNVFGEIGGTLRQINKHCIIKFVQIRFRRKLVKKYRSVNNV